MRIDLDSVLWRTRGQTWDYSFVLRPLHPHLESWYDFHADAFSGVAPSTAPISVGGVLLTNDGEEVRFVATTFQDPTMKDAAGRPVAHYLVWFPNIVGTPGELGIPPDWGPQVVRVFGDHWTTAFASDDVSDDDLLATARSLIKEVPISGVAEVAIQFERRVVEKKKLQALPPSNKTNRAPLVTAAVGVLILAIAIYLLMRRQRPTPPPTSRPTPAQQTPFRRPFWKERPSQSACAAPSIRRLSSSGASGPSSRVCPTSPRA